MPISVKAYIEHERLAFVPTMRQLDDVKIKVITQVNTDPSSEIFPFLIEYDDFQDLEAMFERDPTVNNFEPVSTADGTGIYYIEYDEDTKLISRVMTEVNGFMTQAESKDRGWLVQLQLPGRQALNTIWEHAKDEGFSIDIIEIYDNQQSDTGPSYGLTEEQEQALRVAYENGYFSEPREMSLGGIADELDLSSTAMSGRIRRGITNLISAALIEDELE
ncbi:helix-turn-helix domain-containing protein [Haloarcula amylovorans]|uniref:helix-turn-helix domain-containing protein n=1 Tax=Haloarcula amylovorans TaxID=2562280 RepID=UPI0010762ECF